MIRHDWIEVVDRRWCMRCDAFQSRRAPAGWRPFVSMECEQIYTPARSSTVLAEIFVALLLLVPIFFYYIAGERW